MDITWWFTYVFIPLFIFTARIFDVSIGTLRIVFVSKGFKWLAPLLGFFEVLIWIIAISKIMENLNNWVCYIAYAGGFATGNFVGMWLEEKLAIGVEIIRIITKRDATDLVEALKKKGFGVTFIPAEGSTGKVGVIYTVVKRDKIKQVLPIIKEHNPKAFYTIEDIKFVNNLTENFNGIPQIWKNRKGN